MKNNPFSYSHTNKRYHTFDHYVKETFGEKVVKIGLDGGFTCPNRDGTKGFGGCSFCAGGGAESMAANGAGQDGTLAAGRVEQNGTLGGAGRDLAFGRAECDGTSGGAGRDLAFGRAECDGTVGKSGRQVLPLEIQYEQGRARLEKKWGRCPTIAYFQNFTSTYAPLPRLVLLYEQALCFEDVVGLTIGTRPDCLPSDLLEYLAELNGRTHLTVELGLQTTFDETAKRLNRGHSYNDFLEGYTALKERGIKVAVHLINGLPGESREMMLENARRVAALSPDFLKIHSLYYRKGSALGEAYLLQKEAFPVLTLEEYVSLVADQIELLPPKTVLERVTGDAERKSLLAPLWTCDKKRVVNLLDQVLEQRGSFQGKSLGVVQDAQSEG